jgi:hypothetical protein
MNVQITSTSIKDKECVSLAQNFWSYMPGTSSKVVFYAIRTEIHMATHTKVEGYDFEEVYNVERRYNDFENLHTYLR